MTPEALSQYLLSYGLDPDAVQDTLLEYITWQGPPIRHPKTWAWQRVYWRTVDERRKESIRGKAIHLQQPEIGNQKGARRVPPELWAKDPSPLTQAEQRQRIERFAQLMRTSCKPSHKWSIWNQREV